MLHSRCEQFTHSTPHTLRSSYTSSASSCRTGRIVDYVLVWGSASVVVMHAWRLRSSFESAPSGMFFLWMFLWPWSGKCSLSGCAEHPSGWAVALHTLARTTVNTGLPLGVSVNTVLALSTEGFEQIFWVLEAYLLVSKYLFKNYSASTSEI